MLDALPDPPAVPARCPHCGCRVYYHDPDTMDACCFACTRELADYSGYRAEVQRLRARAAIEAEGEGRHPKRGRPPNRMREA